jgi:hypothetical protein
MTDRVKEFKKRMAAIKGPPVSVRSGGRDRIYISSTKGGRFSIEQAAFLNEAGILEGTCVEYPAGCGLTVVSSVSVLTEHLDAALARLSS